MTKTRNIGGVDIPVVKPEDVPANAVAACMRVEEGKEPQVAGAYQETCSECPSAIWVAPSTPRHLKKICLPCLMDRMKGGNA